MKYIISNKKLGMKYIYFYYIKFYYKNDKCAN